MFYDRYPSDWEPVFDNFGNVINELEPVKPDATIFLRSTLQGDFLKDSGKVKQVSLRIPENLFYDIEALAELGGISRNAVILSLISSGKDLLNDHISNDTRRNLNKIYREKQDLDKGDDNATN